MIPTIGRIVHYTLSADDAEEINKRRWDFNRHRARDGVYQDTGYVAHFGNPAEAGQVFPMMIVAVVGGSEVVNGQVYLDGTDVLWKTDVAAGPDLGQWEWPVVQR